MTAGRARGRHGKLAQVRFPELSRSLPQMTDDLFPEPLDAFEALGAVRVVASRIGTRVSGANAQVVGPQPLSDLREPLEPKVPRAEDQEALFERRDRIAAEVRSHPAPAIEVDLRHPPVAMPLSDLLAIVSDPTLVRDGESPVLLPALRGFLPPALDSPARLVEIGRKPPDPSVPVESALNRSVVESPDPDRRPWSLVRLRGQPRFFELEELALERKAFLCPETVDDAHTFLEPRIASLHRHAEQPEVVSVISDAGTEDEPALRELIDQGQLLRQMRGIVVGRLDDRRRNVHPLRSHGDRRREHHGGREERLRSRVSFG